MIGMHGSVIIRVIQSHEPTLAAVTIVYMRPMRWTWNACISDSEADDCCLFRFGALISLIVKVHSVLPGPRSTVQPRQAHHGNVSICLEILQATILFYYITFCIFTATVHGPHHANTKRPWYRQCYSINNIDECISLPIISEMISY